jgi:nucleoside-diphosphate-sugar epimerase
MMERDLTDLRVLYIGGTGTISASCVRLSLECGMRVYGLNRGNNGAGRPLPDGVTWLKADVTDDASTSKALQGLDFDAVVNFLSYDADDAERSVRMFGDRTKQYVQISSSSVYGKPVLQAPIVESTHNRFLEYARAKLRAEEALRRANRDEGFPVTIMRPAHTCDDANPPLRRKLRTKADLP